MVNLHVNQQELVLVALYRLPYTPLEQNPAWQDINKRLGVYLETQEYRAAIGFLRDLVAAAVFPVHTKEGLADGFNTPWNYVAQHTPALYDPRASATTAARSSTPRRFWRLGRRPLSDWDDVVRTWQSDGGEQMRVEYQDQLAR